MPTLKKRGDTKRIRAFEKKRRGKLTPFLGYDEAGEPGGGRRCF